MYVARFSSPVCENWIPQFRDEGHTLAQRFDGHCFRNPSLFAMAREESGCRCPSLCSPCDRSASMHSPHLDGGNLTNDVYHRLTTSKIQVAMSHTPKTRSSSDTSSTRLTTSPADPYFSTSVVRRAEKADFRTWKLEVSRPDLTSYHDRELT